MLNSLYLPELAFVGAVLGLIGLAATLPSVWAWFRANFAWQLER